VLNTAYLAQIIYD